MIVTNLIRQIHLADENGLKIDRKVTVGSLLKEGEFAVTGKSSSLMLLFSNGTLLTVQENSKVKIRTFRRSLLRRTAEKYLIYWKSRVLLLLIWILIWEHWL